MKVTVKKVKAINGNTYWLTENQSSIIEQRLESKSTHAKINGDTVPLARISITTELEEFDTAPSYFKTQYTNEGSTKQIANHDRTKDLPKAWLLFDTDMNILNTIPIKVEQTGKDYIEAKCHYKVESNGDRSFILDREKIPELTVVKRGSDGYYAISEVYRYGQKVALPLA